jgi:poly(A) polymerase
MARAADPIKAREVAVGVVRRLRDSGHTAYFAGGCVRDACLWLRPTDFDVATDARPEQVRRIFPRSDQVGASFGVVLVHAGSGAERVSVEVATFRADGPYSDARRPDSIAFSDEVGDAQRRDFTVNALFLDPLQPEDPSTPGLGGRLIDHVGGRADLAARIIRAVGDPDARLREDHLRALRAVRFAARLGFTIEPETARAIAGHAAELRGVSRERIGDELRRMLAAPSRARAVGLLAELGLDAPVLGTGSIAPPTGASVLAKLDPAADAVTALAAWSVDRGRVGSPGARWPSGQSVGEWAVRLRAALCLSNEERERLVAALSAAGTLADRWSTLAAAGRKRLAVSPGFGPGLALLRADDGVAAAAIDTDVRELSMDGIGLDPPPVVTGDDLVAAGWRPGPVFKKVLDEVYDAQLEGRVRTRAEGLELARVRHV